MWQQTSPLLGIPVPLVRVPVQVLPVPLVVQFPVDAPLEAANTGPMLESLCPTWESQMELLVPSFSSTQSWLLWLFGRVKQQIEGLSRSV